MIAWTSSAPAVLAVPFLGVGLGFGGILEVLQKITDTVGPAGDLP